MRIAEEPYETIQGEGVLVGTPVLIIRLSGCQLRCSYCDTKFSWDEGTEIPDDEIIKIVKRTDKDWIMFSGGEPLEPFKIQSITKVIRAVKEKYYTVETNGVNHEFDRSLFDIVTVSPKTEADAKYWYEQKDKNKNIYIKVVTDLRSVGLNLIKYADYLMPLTTFNEERDIEIKRRVWWYCVKHNIKYSPRLHVDLFGNKQKV